MRFSLTRPVKIVMLGAGGTGAYIAPHLYRLLHTLKRPVRFVICDGDIVESKNLVRQNFTRADLGENKAKVLAERYSTAFGLETSYVPHFIEDLAQLQGLLTPEVWTTTGQHVDKTSGYLVSNTASELVILLGAVDNNRSRKLCHEAFLGEKELIYIDSGNGEHGGQVVCGIRRAGRTYYPPVGQVFPEVREPTDLFPSELSCADHALAAPQSIVANLTAATVVVNLVYNMLILGESTVRQVSFSTKLGNVRAIATPPRRIAAA